MTTAEHRYSRLACELRSLTRLVVDRAAADLTGADTDLSRLICMDLVPRAFRTVARKMKNRHCFLARVPPVVLELVCRDLSFHERVALSHVSSALRARLLAMPQLWAHILSSNPYPMVYPLRPEVTAEMLHRSAGHGLAMSLSISEESISRWLPFIAAQSDRITALDLKIVWKRDSMSAPASSQHFWLATMDALHAPMPQLRRLALQRVFQISYARFPPMPSPRLSLSLSAALLAENSPALHVCQLTGFTLDLVPGVEFRNMTCFDASWDADANMEEIAQLLAQMPTLRTLGITATTLNATSGNGDAEWAIPHNTLRNLQLRTASGDCSSTVRPLFSINSLRHLDLGRVDGLDDMVSEVYRGRTIARLTIGLHGMTLIVEDDEPGDRTATTIYASVESHSQYDVARVCASTLTWIAIHEFRHPAELENSELPVLPAVDTLILRLAACAEYFGPGLHTMVYYEMSFAIPGIAWHLPSLRHFCVTAPPICAELASYCVCTPHMSISLYDVAHFVRAGLRFDGTPVLDSVRLAGIRIIDLDFCAAWRELRTCTRIVDLVEQPEVVKHMDVFFPYGTDLETRFAASD